MSPSTATLPSMLVINDIVTVNKVNVHNKPKHPRFPNRNATLSTGRRKCTPVPNKTYYPLPFHVINAVLCTEIGKILEFRKLPKGTSEERWEEANCLKISYLLYVAPKPTLPVREPKPSPS